MQLVKKGKKIWGGGPPPPPFRAMPKRKHFFFREGFPYRVEQEKNISFIHSISSINAMHASVAIFCYDLYAVYQLHL